MSFAARLAKHAGLTSAISFTLLTRGWSVASGLATIYFIGRFLTPAVQGYYYTFSSVIALQVFVELGLTYAIVQFASHEMASLTWRSDRTLDGAEGAKKRLKSLAVFSLAWFGGAALMMTVTLIPLGTLIMSLDSSSGLALKDVLPPWAWLVILSSANLLVTATLSLLEGCGQIVEVALLRLVQSLVATVTAWLVFAAGGALYALVTQAAGMLLVGSVGLFWKYRLFFRDLFALRSPLPGMAWGLEIWPFHWRIAVSWVSGYLIFQLFSPLLFVTHGPVAAGQMGLSLQIFGALGGLAMSWISTQIPRYGQMVARREGRALDRLFIRGLAQSSLVLIGCLLLALAALQWLSIMGFSIVQRVLPLPLMVCMAAITMANHVIFAEAALLRAHKQEPFMVVSVLNGLATALIAVALVPAYGLAGAVIAYGLATILIGLGGGTAVFLSKRKAWWAKDV